MTIYSGLDNTWTKEHDSGREFVALKTWSTTPVFNIDAGVDISYRDSATNGNTWNDLAGSGTNVDLNGNGQSAPAFVGDGYGSFDYDGVSDGSWGSPPHNTTFGNISNNYTYIIWALPDDTITLHTEGNSNIVGTSGQRWLIGATNTGAAGDIYSGMGISMGTNGIQVAEHSGAYLPILTKYDNGNAVSGGLISTTKFTQVVVVTTTSGSTSGNPYHKIYINGSLVKIGVESAKAIVYANKGGPSIGYGSYGRFSGNIASVKLFNTALTNAQILREFKAYRWRYEV